MVIIIFTSNHKFSSSSVFQLVDCVAMEAVGAMILVLCLLCCSIASAKELGKSDDELVFVQVVSEQLNNFA